MRIYFEPAEKHEIHLCFEKPVTSVWVELSSGTKTIIEMQVTDEKKQIIKDVIKEVQQL